MKGIQYFVLIGIVLIGFVLVKKYKPTVKNVYPTQSLFFIDEQFSSPFKTELEKFAHDRYVDLRDPQEVIQQVNQEYPEIAMMNSYLCKNDKMCFSFDAPKPVLLVNNEQVLCDNGLFIQKHKIRSDIADSLALVHGKVNQEVERLRKFFDALDSSIAEQFVLEWKDASEISLQNKQVSDEIFVTSIAYIPTWDDVRLCRQLREKNVKQKKKNVVYDLRFKNQIIMR